MKMSSMVGACSAMALCLAVGTAQAGPNPGAPNKNGAKATKKVSKKSVKKAPSNTLATAKPVENLPNRVAGIHRNADGTVKLTTPWYDYNGGNAGQDAVELAFDALQCDETGAPIGGTECDLPGDGYRWYWGTTGWLPLACDDMSLDAKFDNAEATGASFLYWWTNNNTGNYWYIAIFTQEGFGADCNPPYDGGEGSYDGVIFSFNPLGTGFYYTPALGLDAYGLFFQLPADGDGSYLFILADAFDGETLTIAANPAHMGLYGTSEDGGLPNRPGTQTGSMYLDGYNSGTPDANLDDDCLDATFGLCPDPLGNAISFFAEPGGGPGCYPDCVVDGNLDLFDFLCFVNDFNSGGDYSDCVADGQHDLFDFLCFVNAFNAGC